MVSWNCCGIGNPQTVQRLLHLNSKCSPILSSSQKQKNGDDKVLADLEPLRMDSHFLVSPSTTNRGGLALLWKQEIYIQILLSTEHFIDTLITFKNVSFNNTFFYGAPEIPNRQAVWNQLSAISENRDHPWFLTGDFNEIINSSEKSGGK